MLKTFLMTLAVMVHGCALTENDQTTRATSEQDAVRIALAQVRKPTATTSVDRTSAELIRRGEDHPILNGPRAFSLREALASRDVWLVRVRLSDAAQGTNWTEMVFVDRETGNILLR